MNYDQLQYRDESGLLFTEDERQMGLFLHLSALTNMIIPFAGYVIPIVIWQTQKEKMPAINCHGKEAVNWMISSFIYNILTLIMLIAGVIILAVLENPFGILLIVLSFLLLLTISIGSMVVSVIAGVKAGNGEQWHYPFNIKFLK